MKKRSSVLIAVIAVLGLLASAARADEVETRAQNSLSALKQILEIPEKGIPSRLLSDAYGVAIIPDVIKLAFVVGGRYGKGLVMVRKENGRWSLPVFLQLMGGSVGWQIGAQSTDVILVFKTRKSVGDLFQGKFTLGADASVAAGPVGRQASAATDVKLKSEIYSYARSRGAFAGLSLEGAALKVDEDADAAFYGGEAITPSQILKGEVPRKPKVAGELETVLAAHAKGVR